MDRPPQPTRLGTDVVAVSRALFKKVLAEFGSACPRHHDEWEEDGCIDELAAALDAALAAQEGERGGAEVAAAVEAVCAEVERLADAICPPGAYDEEDKAWRVAGSRRYVVSEVRTALADPAGALATHDAEVWQAGYDTCADDAGGDRWWAESANPYRIEAQS